MKNELQNQLEGIKEELQEIFQIFGEIDCLNGASRSYHNPSAEFCEALSGYKPPRILEMLNSCNLDESGVDAKTLRNFKETVQTKMRDRVVRADAKIKSCRPQIMKRIKNAVTNNMVFDECTFEYRISKKSGSNLIKTEWIIAHQGLRIPIMIVEFKPLECYSIRIFIINGGSYTIFKNCSIDAVVDS